MLADSTRSRRPKRHRSILLTIALSMVGTALLIGVADNVPGVAFLYAAAICGTLAFTHHWRAPGPFARLLAGGVLGLVLFAVLHNVAEAGADAIANIPILSGTLQVLSVTFFLIALFLCPAALIVGLAGVVFTSIARHGPSVPHRT